MAMGRKQSKQADLFVTYADVRTSAGHPFYEELNRILNEARFDEVLEKQCAGFYASKKGRPSIAPGVYFRCLLIGFFEGIGSERGIAWRAMDSLSLRNFLGLTLKEQPPDHSTLSRTRHRIDVETHQKVFRQILQIVAKHGLVKGQSLGVDATTLEANAALRSIVRREDGSGYQEYLEQLAKESGIETPTRADLVKVDKKRSKKGSNKDWVHPHDPESKITKMKTGGTHLAHKHEHAVDMETGAIVGISISGGTDGDTQTLDKTLEDAKNHLEDVRDKVDEKTSSEMAVRIEEVTTDKGYHSNDVLVRLQERHIRSYLSEPERGPRRWKNKTAERDAVYANRKRIGRSKGKGLLRRRGELLERAMAHLLNSGGMRRTHLRGHDNISKRLLIQAAGFNLSLVMRSCMGVGKPRALQGRAGLVAALRESLSTFPGAFMARMWQKATEWTRSVFPARRSRKPELHFWLLLA